MSEQNIALSRRFIEEVWSKGNLAVIDEVIAADYVHHDPQSPGVQGPEGLKQFVAMYRSAFPDLHFTIDDLFAVEDKAVVRWTAIGTQQGDLPDLPATGRRSTVSGISINRFAGGKVVEEWVNWDTLGMLQQLGVVPAPEHAAG